MVTATLSGQAKPSFRLGKKTAKLRQQYQITEGIQVASEDPDQKLFSGHAERIHSDYVQDSNAVDGTSPSEAPPTGPAFLGGLCHMLAPYFPHR